MLFCNRHPFWSVTHPSRSNFPHSYLTLIASRSRYSVLEIQYHQCCSKPSRYGAYRCHCLRAQNPDIHPRVTDGQRRHRYSEARCYPSQAPGEQHSCARVTSRSQGAYLTRSSNPSRDPRRGVLPLPLQNTLYHTKGCRVSHGARPSVPPLARGGNIHPPPLVISLHLSSQNRL